MKRVGKQWYKKKRAVSIVTMLCGIGWLLLKSYVISSVTITLDPLFSSTVQQQIHDLTTVASIADTPNYLHNLAAKIPAIDNIHVQYNAAGVVLVEVTSKQPQVRVNNEYIFTADGTVLACDNFSPQYVARKPQMSTSDVHAAACMHWALNVPAAFLYTNTVHWIAESEIRVRDVHNQLYLIDNRTDSLIRMRTNSDKMYAFTTTEYASPKKNKEWVADMRFAKQVILYPSPGGTHYG